MSTAFDTLAAARDMEAAGLERVAAEAVAAAIRAGQGELATKADLKSEIGSVRAEVEAVRSDITGLRWVIGLHVAIGLATLAGVLAMAFRS